VFYAQSLSLVEYLNQVSSPEEFVRFVKLAASTGNNHALKVVYNINGIDDLQQRWRLYANAPANADLKMVANLHSSQPYPPTPR
jgi:hypothetical protein